MTPIQVGAVVFCSFCGLILLAAFFQRATRPGGMKGEWLVWACISLLLQYLFE